MNIDINKHNIDPNVPLWQLSVGQFMELINLQPTVVVDHTPQEESPRHEYGISGLARIFNCSPATAWRIKDSGVIDEAIFQYGRTIVVDVEKAVALGKKFIKNKR